MPRKNKLTPFVDRLPVPPTIQPKKRKRKGTYYEVFMTEFTQKLHRDLPPTRLWGYNGMYPGPTFEVRKNENVYVKWMNQLPPRHLLPVDKTIHGADMGVPSVRTVVHLHSGVTRPSSDGHPEAWFTAGFKKTGPKFKHKIYHYSNPQRASTLWYHDHSLGITRLNMYTGLAGFYLIRDEEEKSLNLPKGKYEIPLLVQDRSLNEDGSLFYPKQPTPATARIPSPSIVPGFAGDTIVVNGKVWPYLEVEPRKYRFRLLNGSNSRVYTFSLDSGQSFTQIGTDGGLLRSPVRIKTITLAPAERADIIIDFSKQKGKTIVLKNNAPIPFPKGDPVDPKTTANVLQFRVTKPLSSKDTSVLPQNLSKFASFSVSSTKKIRTLSFVETKDRYGREKLLLDNKAWHDPVTEIPQLGDVEIWNLINPTMHTHPIHLHLVQFQILYRRPFDVKHYQKTGKLLFTGPPKPSDLNERGLKDVVRTNPGEVTGIITRFGPYPGEFMWHCHILEHEDYDMMRPFVVRNKREVLLR